jgi:DNA-binding NarL/FixJ family response regulator
MFAAKRNPARKPLALANQLRPDIVVMDLTMPGMTGLEALRTIKNRLPHTGIVVLTPHFSETLVREIFKAGARGYVMKSDADRDLVDAVTAVAAGKTYSTVVAAPAQAAQPAEPTTIPRNQSTLLPGSLTNREREAVRTLAQTMRKLL